jgi:hypothetical protein
MRSRALAVLALIFLTAAPALAVQRTVLVEEFVGSG